MKERKVGIITLALTLIALGVILTVNNMVSINLGKTLQILVGASVVALGVEFIWVETNNRKGDERLRLRVSGLCLTLLVVMYIVASILPLAPFEVTIENGSVITRGFTFFDNYKTYNFTFHQTLEESAQDLSQLSVKNKYGDVKVVSSDATTIKVEASLYVTVLDNDEEKAKAYSDEAIKVTKGNNILNIATIIPPHDASISVDYTIYVPATLLTEVVNNNGDIAVEGVKEANVVNKYGDIAIKDIEEAVTVDNKNGKVAVIGIGGPLTVENKYGDITIKSIKGSADIKNSNGKININTLEGDLKVDNRYDDIELEDVSGAVTISLDNGKIRGSKVGKNVVIEATYGEITLDDIGGNVEIDNKNDKITVTGIKGYVDITSKNSEIVAKGIDQDAVIKTRYSAVELEDVKGKVNVETTNDDIELTNIGSDIKAALSSGHIIAKNISGDLNVNIKYGDVRVDNRNTLLHNVDIDNENGDVTLNVPDHQEGKFNLYSKYGRINVNNGLVVDEDDTNEQTAKGVIGNNENAFYIQASNGNVTIE